MLWLVKVTKISWVGTNTNQNCGSRILHSAAEPQDEVKGALLLDVVVGEGAPVLQLLSGEDQSLLVRRNALLVLNKHRIIKCNPRCRSAVSKRHQPT